MNKHFYTLLFIYYSLFESDRKVIDNKCVQYIQDFKTELQVITEEETRLCIVMERFKELKTTVELVKELQDLQHEYLHRVELRLHQYKQRNVPLDVKKVLKTMQRIRELTSCVTIMKNPDMITVRKLRFVKSVIRKLVRIAEVRI